MLIFVPITFVFKMVGATEGFIFFGSLLALIPLAALLGCTTEALASYTNQTRMKHSQPPVFPLRLSAARAPCRSGRLAERHLRQRD